MGSLDPKYLLIAGAVAIMAGPQILAFFKKATQPKPAAETGKAYSRSSLITTLIDLQDDAALISPEAAKSIGAAVITLIGGSTK